MEELNELIDCVTELYKKEKNDLTKRIIGQYLVNLQIYRERPSFYIDGNWLHIHFPNANEINICDHYDIVYDVINDCPTITFVPPSPDLSIKRDEIANIKRYVKDDQALQNL